MCQSHDATTNQYIKYQKELTDAGLLIKLGVPGLYAVSGVFENVVERFDAHVTRMGQHLKPEVLRFPPVINRRDYMKTGHIETFPNLMGSIHSFQGDDAEHHAMLAKTANALEWTKDLKPVDVMMVPAACYPLYPTATGTLPEGGRLVDLRSFVFRHEPSEDPARMQLFRMREFVRLATPEQALEHRQYWLTRSKEVLNAVGLDVKVVLANDPFFGQGRRMMIATQKEQTLKYELVIPVASAERPTAVASCNLHLNHFGHAFDIRTAEGNIAHTACVGFGLERVALALFKTHGLETKAWPASVKQVLEL
jgi:seryl-tRNA synthetase